MDLTIITTEARVYTKGYKTVQLDCEGVILSDLFDQLKIEDIIEHFGENEILELIGKDRVKEYFGLIDEDED